MSHSVNEKNNRAGRIIVLAAIAAVIAVLLAAIAAYGRNNRPIETAEQLIEHIESTPVNEDAESVTEALLSWKLPEFDQTLLMTIEACYEVYYYKDLPAIGELAKDTAISFAKNFAVKRSFAERITASDSKLPAERRKWRNSAKNTEWNIALLKKFSIKAKR